MNENDEKIRKFLEKEDIPEELAPENIKKMLDEKAPSKKRNKISVSGRLGALAVACAVIVGSTVTYTKLNRQKKILIPERMTENSETSSAESATTPETEMTIQKTGNYMAGAEDYEQVYNMVKKVADNHKAINGRKSLEKGAAMEIAGEDIAENAVETLDEEAFDDTAFTAGAYASEDTGAGEEFSETYNQEENVLEADIVKTNGKNIYYATNDYNKSSTALVNYATVDKGNFTGYGTIDIYSAVEDCFGAEYTDNYTYVQDMYLYNDMLVVLGTVNGSKHGYDDEGYDIYYDYKNSTFVTFYTTDETPQLIDTYYQEGNYNDVRISPEGYMYLITGYSSWDFYEIDDYNDIEKYVPMCGVSDNIECIPAGDILLPEDDSEEMYNLSYTVIGSLDLTQSGTFSAVDTKALAGYTGEIYCSGDNMYTTSGWDETDITRISINSGMITPEVSGKVSGHVNDQFSMSEYNGYFRIAVTNDEYEEVYHEYNDEEDAWYTARDVIGGDESSGYYSNELIKRDNRVYVLDMDLNVVGSVTDFGIDESIKSVKFSGDMAYVVTYEQTDPLFAIDLSDPTNPTILDEFKILGYSTYMQEWGDGLLLGFGVNADENGIETGIKLTMFDNSDPYNLNALATYTLDRGEDEWLYSEAVWERKALLIAPEKNLIGIPVIIENYSYDISEETQFNNISKYMFFEYTDDEFIFKGEISATDENAWIVGFSRAVYIGDYVYALSDDKFVSADIETITECDKVYFDDATDYQSLVIEPETEEPTEPETEEITESETEITTEEITTEEFIEPETEITKEEITESEPHETTEQIDE